MYMYILYISQFFCVLFSGTLLPFYVSQELGFLLEHRIVKGNLLAATALLRFAL